MKNNLSPYVLLQELVWPDRWKSTLACILLNRTKRAQVDKVWPSLFILASSAEELLKIPDEELKSILKPLGLSNMRSKRLKKLANDWIAGKPFHELTGIGQYAIDSDNIFYQGILPDTVSDHALSSYLKWKRNR